MATCSPPFHAVHAAAFDSRVMTRQWWDQGCSRDVTRLISARGRVSIGLLMYYSIWMFDWTSGDFSQCRTLPFYFLGVLPSISALCAMSNSAKKKTTAMREVRAPQPGAAHQCRRLLFDWPLPRTHAHIFACRWLGACMPPPTPPAEVQQSPGVLLQQQNGPSVCFPNAGYRVISTCADPNRPVQRES